MRSVEDDSAPAVTVQAGTGVQLRAFDWGVGKLCCAAFSPDGLTCATCGGTGQVVVWDVDV